MKYKTRLRKENLISNFYRSVRSEEKLLAQSDYEAYEEFFYGDIDPDGKFTFKFKARSRFGELNTWMTYICGEILQEDGEIAVEFDFVQNDMHKEILYIAPIAGIAIFFCTVFSDPIMAVGVLLLCGIFFALGRIDPFSKRHLKKKLEEIMLLE